MSLYQIEVAAKALGLDVFGMTAEEARPIWEYVDGQRTETQRTNEAGRALFRHPALLRVAGQRPFEGSVVLDQAEGLGELIPVVMTPDSRVTIRGARSEYGGVELNVEGSVLKSEKQTAK